MLLQDLTPFLAVMSAAVQARRWHSSLNGFAMQGCQLCLCCFARAGPVFLVDCKGKSVKPADKPDFVRWRVLQRTSVTAINLGRESPARLGATYPPTLLANR